jgi:hypothetical protein
VQIRLARMDKKENVQSVNRESLGQDFFEFLKRIMNRRNTNFIEHWNRFVLERKSNKDFNERVKAVFKVYFLEFKTVVFYLLRDNSLGNNNNNEAGREKIRFAVFKERAHDVFRGLDCCLGTLQGLASICIIWMSPILCQNKYGGRIEYVDSIIAR